jgi:hypothetical protein
MKKSSIIAAVAPILALGVGLKHDALAGGRFKSGHFADGKRSASEFDDRQRPTNNQACHRLSVHRTELLR